MEGLRGLFDALYTRFLLRDVLAKATPGAFVLGSLATCFLSVRELFEEISRLSLLAGVVLYCASYLVGLVLQSIGMHEWGKARFTLIKIPMHGSEVDRCEWSLHVQRNSTRMQRARNERAVVLKELMGIGTISLWLSGPLILLAGVRRLHPHGACDWNWNGVLFVFIGIAMMIAGCLTRGMNKWLFEQERQWKRTVIRNQASLQNLLWICQRAKSPGLCKDAMEAILLLGVTVADMERLFEKRQDQEPFVPMGQKPLPGEMRPPEGHLLTFPLEAQKQE